MAQEWQMQELLNTIDKSVYIYDNDDIKDFQVLKSDYLELILCSGLKDKDNNDIYENDICFDSKTQEFFKVYYENSKWLILSLENDELKELFDNHKDLTVIGNVFEGIKKIIL